MFGLFKPKELDIELLKKNVTESILDIWADANALSYSKFSSFVEYAVMIDSIGTKPSKFYTEKLRFIVSVTITLLQKNGVEDSVINDIVNAIKTEANNIDAPEAKGSSTALALKAKEYVEIRFSTNPREAGKLLETKFSQEAFGFIPSKDDTNRWYTLYKSLTAFERDSIFKIDKAISNSQL